MWYKVGAYAIRIAGGGRQLFQISKKGASKEQLERIILQGLQMLKEVKPVDEVKATCKARAATL